MRVADGKEKSIMILAFLKAKPLIAWALGGAIAVGGAAGAYVYNQSRQDAPPAQVASVDPGSDTQPAGEAQTPSVMPVEEAEQPAVGEEAAQSDLPRFDVLRVEPDGSTVVAGAAPAGSAVELVEGGSVLATTQAGPGGDFAIVLDKPLAPGAHELTLRATTQAGEVLVSGETGIVNVPEGDGELLAMVSKEGEASRILQKPEELSGGAETTVPSAETADDETVEGEAPATETPVAQEESVAAAPQPEAAPETQSSEGEAVDAAEAPASEGATDEVEVANADPQVESAPATEPAAGPSAEPDPVLISAIDVENGRIFVAGTGEPGRIVTVYLDGERLGSATIGAQGGFLMEAARELDAGNYEVRADMLSGDGSSVARRAAVRLSHEEPSVSVAQAEPEIWGDADAAEQPQSTAEAETATPSEEVETSVAQGQAEPAEAKESAQSGGQQVAVAQEQPQESASEPAAGSQADQPASSGDAEDAGASQTQEVAETQSSEDSGEQVAAAADATEESSPGDAASANEEVAAASESETPEIKSGASVIIRRGDNLWRISRRMLGRGIRYTVIYEANRDQIRDPSLIFPGQVFDVPGATDTMDRG